VLQLGVIQLPLRQMHVGAAERDASLGESVAAR
jgi:hypothetical protein